MNKDKDKLDELFRKGMEDPVDEAGYQETDWNALEQMLDKRKKRRGFIYWLPVLSSAAALLLFWGWWAFRPNPAVQHQNLDMVANNLKSANAEKNNGQKRPVIEQPVVNPSASRQPVPVSPDYAKNHDQKGRTGGNKPSFIAPAKGSVQDGFITQPHEIKSTQFTETLAAVSEMPSFEPGSANAATINSFDIPRPLVSSPKWPDAAKENKIKRKPAFHPQYTLSVLAAPDLNTAGSFQQGKLGTNVGLLFSAGVFRKFTISTGAIYADKPYLTNFENYHTQYLFREDPLSVSANCSMIDIPLNIDYQLYSRHNNKISVGTGLSSYIMLTENYAFNYDPYASGGPTGFSVPNSEKYFFSVLNLNATYQRQLNSKVGISVQPYLKLPLANIGYSQVRLQTTGVAVGFTWNLNSASKH